MQTQKPFTSLWLAGVFMTWNLMGFLTAFADTTFSLEQPVHFINAEGSDVILQAGDYVIEPAQEWLQVTPSEGRAVDALLLEAQTASHEESLTEPLALSSQGETPDTHHLALLLPDGTGLEAVGTYSGIRFRAGRASGVFSAKMRALAAKQNSAIGVTVPEWSSLFFGGGGGVRNFNLDCGSTGIMTGALARWGSWMHELTILCRRVNTTTGQLGSEFSVGPTVGTAGGQSQPAIRCPDGLVVAGIQTIRYGSFVHNMLFACAPWNPRDKKVDETGPNRLLWLGPAVTGGVDSSAYSCPSGKVGKAFRGRSGDFIDKIRFVCDSWNQ